MCLLQLHTKHIFHIYFTFFIPYILYIIARSIVIASTDAEMSGMINEIFLVSNLLCSSIGNYAVQPLQSVAFVIEI